MEEAPHEVIIIKHVGGGEEEGHHGGAWKIAFADFMTAMMAFFLVLWIINATSKDTKTVIARYFNPVKLEDPAKAKKGIVQNAATSDVSADDAQKQNQASSSPAASPPAASAPGQLAAASPPSANASMRGTALNPAGTARTSSSADAESTKGIQKEDALFADPYASLDRIASAPSADARPADAPRAPAKAISDPFRPITLGSTQDLTDGTGAPISDGGAGGSEQGSSPQSDSSKSATAPNPSHASSPSTQSPSAQAQSQPLSPSQTRASPSESSQATVAASDRTEVKATVSDAHARLVALGRDVARALQKDLDITAADAGPAVKVEASDEGLLISVTDKLNFSMFSVGSAEPDKRTLRVMEDIAKVLKAEPGAIVIRGFTDARPFHSAKYDNWRLSSARAQMAYYMLVHGGVPEVRFDRIEGYGDHRLKDPKNPLSPVNRRIEILVKPEK